MQVTLLFPPSTVPIDREFNAGLGSGFSVGRSVRARILESLRHRIADSPFLTFGYIAAILSQNGHTVTSSTEIPAEGVVIIAPSLANYGNDMRAIQAVAARPDLRLIVVGHLASVRPQDFSPYADLVITGEPESVIQEVKDDSMPEGIVAAELVADLDSLPFPNWNVFPTAHSRFSYVFSDAPYALVQGSRSCPYKCDYCPYLTVGRYRRRSVKSVIAELEFLSATRGVRGVIFRDPTFAVSRDWALEFCRALGASGLSVRWECETRLDRLDAELLREMRSVGLRSVKVGIESADPNVLRDVNRVPIGIRHQEEIVSTCRELGVSVVGFYVLGLPSDTVETIRGTIEYAKRLNTDIARFHIFTPLPGTPLYDAMQHRVFETNWEKFDQFNVVFRHDHLSKEALLALKEEAFVSYYFRWSFLWTLAQRTLGRRIKRRLRTR